MSNQSLPIDADTAAEPDDVVIRRLARALDYAEGFWLGFAKSNSPAQRRKLAADCRALLEALKITLVEIELTGQIDDLLPVLKERLPPAREAHRRGESNSSDAAQPGKLVVFVYGLEHSIPSREAYPPLLSSLNLNRELFRQHFPHPLVLWLPDYALTALARKAPDFWAWRSGLYEFAPERELTDQSYIAVREQAVHITGSLSEQAKRERLVMLKGLLDDYHELGDGLHEQAARANILHNLGVVYYMLGELFEALQAYETSRSIWRHLKDELNEASAIHNLAIIAYNMGGIEEARRLYNESLEIEKRLGDESGIAATLHELGGLAQDVGELDEARRLYNESLEIKKRLGDESGVALTLHNLAMLAQQTGDIEEARRLYNESLEINTSLGDRSSIAGTLHQLGMLAQQTGDIEEARRLYNESLEINTSLGNQAGIAITLHQLGRLALKAGKVDEARRLYNESLEIKKRLGNLRGMALTLRQLGKLAENGGEVAEAARLYREALGHLERIKSPYVELARKDLERIEAGSSS